MLVTRMKLSVPIIIFSLSAYLLCLLAGEARALKKIPVYGNQRIGDRSGQVA